MIGLCALASAASAEPTPSERDKARDFMASGRALRTASDYQAALRSFTAANEIMHVPTTLFEVAATQSALGQLIAARDTLKVLARLPREPNEPEAFIKARHTGNDLLTSIERRIPTIDVSIEGDLGSHVSGLSIDGRANLEGREFDGIQLDPGLHRLVATSGFLKREQSVSLVEGESTHVELLLETAHVRVDVPKSTDAKAVAARGDATPWVLYSLGALGVAGLGAGVGFALQAEHVKSSLENSCAPVCTTEQVNRVGHWTTAANVSFGVGGAAVVAAVVMLIVQANGSSAPQASKSRALAFEVLPSPQGPSFVASGHF